MRSTFIAAAALGAVSLFGTANAGSVVLTDATFDAEVFDSGKNAFVKFYAPWCGHCKTIKPFWEELGTEYESSSSVIIGDVDCTVETGLCSKQGVSGYPTIKYFMSGEKEAKSYEKGRDLASLRAFTADTLEIKCSITETSGCSEKEVKFLETFKVKDGAAVKKELTRLQGMKAGSMKPDLKQWLVQRVNILKQLDADA